MRFLFLFLFFFQPVFGMQWAFRDPALGVQTLTYFDQVRERPVVVEFWYPAERKGLRERPESDSLMVHPEEFRGAPMKKGKGKCPLILISHGHRGDRRDLSWLAERLVSQGGFLVAAVDHFGDQRKHFDMQKSIRFWDRALDFTFLLNQLEKEESFLDKIDFDKVGFVGYSLGGMTGLGLAGAQAENLKEILPLLQNELSDFPNHVLERFDFAESERSFLEPRIRGAFLICPATFPYTSEALKKVSIPIGLVVTVGDEVLPFNEHAFRLIRYLVPKKLKVLGEDISHSVFINRPTELGKKLWSKASSLRDRGPIHQEVGDFAIEFFREILQSDKLPRR